MEGYTAIIKESSKELSVKERISIKDTTSALSIDDITTTEGHLRIEYAYHVVLDITNERSENKNYTKVIVVAKDGTKYVTGSKSFLDVLSDIVEEMTAEGLADEIVLDVYRIESKNYKGKSFITASLI